MIKGFLYFVCGFVIQIVSYLNRYLLRRYAEINLTISVVIVEEGFLEGISVSAIQLYGDNVLQ